VQYYFLFFSLMIYYTYVLIEILITFTSTLKNYRTSTTAASFDSEHIICLIEKDPSNYKKAVTSHVFFAGRKKFIQNILVIDQFNIFFLIFLEQLFTSS